MRLALFGLVLSVFGACISCGVIGYWIAERGHDSSYDYSDWSVNKQRAYFGYHKAEFNVRYRKYAGSDGLEGEWTAIRDAYRPLYEMTVDPPDDALDKLYIAEDAIEHREPAIDLAAARKTEAELEADIDAGRWPPQ